MKFKHLYVLIIALLVSACATEGKYKNALNTWLGSSEISLIQAWGPPQQSYETNGHKFLVYSSSSNMFLPGTSPTYQTTLIGNTAYTNSYGGTPAVNVALSCVTTFEIVNETITNWRYQGNNCVSK